MNSVDLQKYFLEVYEKSSNAIFRFCYFRTGDREKAKDLMQETFMKAWVKMTENKIQFENFNAYLYRIAKNLIVDDIRKKKESSLEAMMEKGFQKGEDNEEEMKIKIEAEKAINAIGQLDDDYREVITLRYIEELSIGEIAQVMKVSENLVSVRINRGLKQLNKILNKSNHERVQ